MPVTARLNYLRIAPRKVRQVSDLIRGKKVSQALILLQFITRKPSLPLAKLLKQAVANAKNSFGLDEGSLYISKITVDEGPKLKRWMPRARGRASEIQKKTSHITLILGETEEKKAKTKKKAKKEIKKIEEPEDKERILKTDKPKKRPEIGVKRPRAERMVPRIFRRKSF